MRAGRTRRHRSREGGGPAAVGWPEHLVEAGLVGLLVFTPLAYGTVEPWAEAVAGLLVLGMVLAWVLGMTLRDWEVRVALPPGWGPAAALLALVVLQALPLPTRFATLVSPGVVEIQRVAAADGGATVGADAGARLVTLSLAPQATAREALKLLAVGALVLVLYNTVRTRGQARRALWAMILVGAGIAVFGIVQRMTWNGRLYWVGPEAPAASFGPFVNRTHYAGLVAIVVPAALAFVLASRREGRRAHRARRWGDRLRGWLGEEGGPGRLVPVFLVLMGGAALVAGSRGGVVAVLGALLVMTGLGAHGRRGGGRAARLALATALVILAALWIGGDVLEQTLKRLAAEVGRPEESDRVHLWTDALELWRAFPVVGTGLASWGVAYPALRTLRASAVFTHAESDWVQLLTDTGLVGLGLTLATGATVAVALLRRYRRAADRWGRSFALGGLVALVGTAVQGIGNYNLPVLSSWVYLGTVLALALGAEAAAGGSEEAERGAAGDRGAAMGAP